MVETVSFRAFLEANWGTYGYGYLWWPGVEVTDETGKLPPYARLCYICAKFRLHPIVFPLRSLRGRCRLRQMRCNYIRAVGATLLTYVSVSSVNTGRDTAKNVFVECKCSSKNVAANAADLITPHPSPKVTPSPQAPQGEDN